MVILEELGHRCKVVVKVINIFPVGINKLSTKTGTCYMLLKSKYFAAYC